MIEGFSFACRFAGLVAGTLLAGRMPAMPLS
jgi:hypothetical protein